MAQTVYGQKYERGLDAKDIAARIRAACKARQKAGELPAGKLKVRLHRYAGGRSIDVRLFPETPEKLVRREYIEALARGERPPCVERWTEEGLRVRKLLDAEHDAYNFDGSDTQTDYFNVNYYGDAEVKVGDYIEAQIAREKAEPAAAAVPVVAAPAVDIDEDEQVLRLTAAVHTLRLIQGGAK